MKLGHNLTLTSKRSHYLNQYAAPYTGYKPIAVWDFENNVFSLDGLSPHTMQSSLNIGNTTPKTVIDSDGVLKWAAHNVAGKSPRADGEYGVTYLGAAPNAPAGSHRYTASYTLNSGTSQMLRFGGVIAGGDGHNRTAEFWIRAADGESVTLSFDVEDYFISTFTVTDTWTKVTGESQQPRGNSGFLI